MKHPWLVIGSAAAAVVLAVGLLGNGSDESPACKAFNSGEPGKAMRDGIALVGDDAARSDQLLEQAQQAAEEVGEDSFAALGDALAEYRTAIKQKLPVENASRDVQRAIQDVRESCGYA